MIGCGRCVRKPLLETGKKSQIFILRALPFSEAIVRETRCVNYGSKKNVPPLKIQNRGMEGVCRKNSFAGDIFHQETNLVTVYEETAQSIVKFTEANNID